MRVTKLHQICALAKTANIRCSHGLAVFGPNFSFITTLSVSTSNVRLKVYGEFGALTLLLILECVNIGVLMSFGPLVGK